MIEKLKYHSVEELKSQVEKYGDLFGSLLSVASTRPLPPTEEEIVAKINEIIDYLNGEKK